MPSPGPTTMPVPAFAAAIGASADHVTDQDADPGPVQLNVRLREPLSDADMLAEPPTLEAPSAA